MKKILNMKEELQNEIKEAELDLQLASKAHARALNLVEDTQQAIWVARDRIAMFKVKLDNCKD